MINGKEYEKVVVANFHVLSRKLLEGNPSRDSKLTRIECHSDPLCGAFTKEVRSMNVVNMRTKIVGYGIAIRTKDMLKRDGC